MILDMPDVYMWELYYIFDNLQSNQCDYFKSWWDNNYSWSKRKNVVIVDNDIIDSKNDLKYDKIFTILCEDNATHIKQLKEGFKREIRRFYKSSSPYMSSKKKRWYLCVTGSFKSIWLIYSPYLYQLQFRKMVHKIGMERFKYLDWCSHLNLWCICFPYKVSILISFSCKVFKEISKMLYMHTLFSSTEIFSSKFLTSHVIYQIDI